LAGEPSSITAGTAYNKYGLLQGNKLFASATFAATYGVTSGLWVDGSRVEIKNNTIVGTFDRSIGMNGSSHISNNHIVGAFSYGIFAGVDNDNSADATYTKITDNYVELQGNGSSGIHFRNSCATAFSMPVVQIDANVMTLGPSGQFTGGEQSAISVSAYRLASGNNIIQQVQTNNNIIRGRSGVNTNAFVLFGTQGSGANGGRFTQWSAIGNSGDFVANVFRVDVVTTGDVVNANVADATFLNVASRALSNFTLITAPKVRNLRGQRVSETSGTATITTAATSVTVTMNLQDTMRPTSLANISVRPTNNLGTATKWWIDTLSGDTFQIKVDAAPGATTATFAWEAKNIYY
jgi:hypothetical protein